MKHTRKRFRDRETFRDKSISADVLSMLWKRILPLNVKQCPLKAFRNCHIKSLDSNLMRPKEEKLGAKQSDTPSPRHPRAASGRIISRSCRLMCSFGVSFGKPPTTMIVRFAGGVQSMLCVCVVVFVCCVCFVCVVCVLCVLCVCCVLCVVCCVCFVCFLCVLCVLCVFCVFCVCCVFL